MAENEDSEQNVIGENQATLNVGQTIETAMIGIKVARLLADKDDYTHDSWKRAMPYYGDYMLPYLDIVWPVVNTALMEGGVIPTRRNRARPEQSEAENEAEADDLQPEIEQNLQSTPTETKGIIARFQKIPKAIRVLVLSLVVVLGLLALTNPSMAKFKEFLPQKISDTRIHWDNVKCSRTRNWLIFSIYEFEYARGNIFDGSSRHSEGQFWGIFNNFFEK